MAKPKHLGPKFWRRKTLRVARDLVGCFLARRIGDIEIRLGVTEAEAYTGSHDLACHSARGKTERTEVMFEPGGVFYVYFVYGMHYMLNIVTEGKGQAAGVLVRGIEGCYGPGNVTKALKIDKTLYGKKAAPESGLWFEPREKGEKISVVKSPRIGVDYAGPIWSRKHYRFTLVRVSKRKTKKTS